MDIEEIIKGHLNLLEEKGYLKAGKSNAQSDAYGSQLKKKLVDAMQTTTDEQPAKWLRITLTGKLYKEGDITYNFNYCYDRRINDLLFASVEALYKDLWKVSVFYNPKQCPTVKDINALVRPKALRRKPRLIREDSDVNRKVRL